MKRVVVPNPRHGGGMWCGPPPRAPGRRARAAAAWARWKWTAAMADSRRQDGLGGVRPLPSERRVERVDGGEMRLPKVNGATMGSGHRNAEEGIVICTLNEIEMAGFNYKSCIKYIFRSIIDRLI